MMCPIMRKTADKLRETRGSALMSVFLIIVVLLALGAGILILSTANTKQAKVDNVYERDYYVADGNAKQAVEVLKAAALEKYRLIADDLSKGIMSSNNQVPFFDYINAVANNYNPPQPDGAAGGPNHAAVSITHTNWTGCNTTQTYTVVSSADDGTTARKITSSIDIVFVPVKVEGAAFTPLGSETILCGGTFWRINGDINVYNNGTVRFSAYSNPLSKPPDYQGYDGFTIANESTGYWIVPGTDKILNWDMDYPGFTDDPQTAATPTFTVGNNGTLSSLGGKKAPIYIQGASGASFTVKSINSGFTSGQIVSSGKLTLESMTLSGSSGNYIKLYSGGDMDISSTPLNYCKLFVDGNLSIDGGSDKSHLIIYCKGSVSISSTGFSDCTIICGGSLSISGGGSTNNTIYCNGTITDGSNNRTNMKVYCKSYSMSGGNIYGDTIVYAENYIHLESTVTGLFYSNGTIDVTSGSGLTGQMAAKGDIYADGSFSYWPDAALLARLYADPFVSSSPGASVQKKIVQPPDSSIFVNTPKFAEN